MASELSDPTDPFNEPSQWEWELTGSFEVLLGQSLENYDPSATYALFHWDDMMSAEFFDFLEDVADLGAVIPPGPFDAHEGGIAWTRWSLDLGRSLFLLDKDPGLGATVDALLHAASRDDSQTVVTGTDLGSALIGQEFDSNEVVLQVLARVQTDGTLFDAMRAATWTMGDPVGLLGFDVEVEVEEKWEKALERVGHPGLRDHLRMLCLTQNSARCDGGFYLGASHCPSDLRWLEQQLGHKFVAGWEFGEGQASSAIFQISA